MLRALKVDDLDVTCDPEWLQLFSKGLHCQIHHVLTHVRFSEEVCESLGIQFQKIFVLYGINNFESKESGRSCGTW
jgi:hypothetical protein